MENNINVPNNESKEVVDAVKELITASPEEEVEKEKPTVKDIIENFQEIAEPSLTPEEQLITMTNIALTLNKELTKVKEELMDTEVKLQITYDTLTTYNNLFNTFVRNLPSREDYMIHAQGLNLAVEKIRDL